MEETPHRVGVTEPAPCHDAAPDGQLYPEKHLPTVLQACLNAATVVVYCTGGDCEDSEFVALSLAEASVATKNFRVYAGGFNEWSAQGLPMETGARHSGELKGGRK